MLCPMLICLHMVRSDKLSDIAAEHVIWKSICIPDDISLNFMQLHFRVALEFLNDSFFVIWS